MPQNGFFGENRVTLIWVRLPTLRTTSRKGLGVNGARGYGACVDFVARRFRSVHVPVMARVGPRVVRELGDDAVRLGVERAGVVWSGGLPEDVVREVRKVLADGGVDVVAEALVEGGTVAEGEAVAAEFLANGAKGVIAVGGGRALDVGKYAGAHIVVSAGGEGQTEGAGGMPVICVPTSLSHDGFGSPSASLVGEDGKRVSVKCEGPAGVLVDTVICAKAPRLLLLAGLGDVMAKVSALADWALAEHAGLGERVDGVAAVIARGSIAEGLAIERWDEHGVERLARGLMLGGVAMGVAGSSRPCSGSEHLISHALDQLRIPVGSHGVQVGLAALVTATLQATGEEDLIARVYDKLGFWEAVEVERKAGLTREMFMRAVEGAGQIKPGYITVLSRPGALAEAARVVRRWL